MLYEVITIEDRAEDDQKIIDGLIFIALMQLVDQLMNIAMPDVRDQFVLEELLQLSSFALLRHESCGCNFKRTSF